MAYGFIKWMNINVSATTIFPSAHVNFDPYEIII